jgi:hypothetical protein
MQPHIESLLSLFLSTIELYNVWLIDLAGRHAMVQAQNLMRDTLALWCGGTYAIPPAILESLNDHGLRADSGMRQCLEKMTAVKEQLAVTQDYIQDCLKNQRLSPYEHTLLVHCATALQQCDPDHPSFPLRL